MKVETGWRDYWRKWRGSGAGEPPRVSNGEVFWSWLGAALGISLVASVGAHFFAPHDLLLLLVALLVNNLPRSRRYPEAWF